MIERTLVLVKPDGVARGLVGEVLGRIERRGYTLVAADLRTIDRPTAEAHYAEHDGKPFFDDLVTFITSGRVGHPGLALDDGGHEPDQCRPGHDPRRPGHADAEQRHPRLRQPRVGRA